MKTLLTILVLLFAVVGPSAAVQAQDAAQPEAKETLAQLDADAAQARQRVIEIVNQPVTHLARTSAAAMFSPGWFHPGAIKPDFNSADIRTTQTVPYDGDAYVTSDLNPSEMFIGDELEFNAATKYFYTDRTLPKKRLSEPEMLEVNRLYRVIGRDEQAHAVRWQVTAAVALVVVIALCLLFLFATRGRRSSPQQSVRSALAARGLR